MPIRVSRASATTVKFSTPQEIIIDHANDSIRLGDGTTLTTVTTVGPKTGLDVNVLNDPQIELDHTDGDSVFLGDGTNDLTSSNLESKWGLDVREIRGTEVDAFDSAASVGGAGGVDIVTLTLSNSTRYRQIEFIASATKSAEFTLRWNNNGVLTDLGLCRTGDNMNAFFLPRNLAITTGATGTQELIVNGVRIAGGGSVLDAVITALEVT